MDNNIYMEFYVDGVEDTYIMKFRSEKSLEKHIKDYKVKKEDIVQISFTPIKKKQDTTGTMLRSLFGHTGSSISLEGFGKLNSL